MTTLSTTLSQPKVLAALGTVGFAAALAAASQVAIPIPGTPVPITLQPMVVVLAGMMLGARLGAASMLLYIIIGSLGVPVWAPMGAPGIARLMGPTGGYIIAYPVVAFVAGAIAAKFPTLIGRWAAAMCGMIVLFIGGVTQLTILTGSLGQALAFGVTPFALFDIVKAFIAALVARPLARARQD